MKLVFLCNPVEKSKRIAYFLSRETWFWGSLAWRREQELSTGGIFLVDSVDEIYRDNKDTLEFIKGPVDVPPGRYAIYKDNSGNL